MNLWVLFLCRFLVHSRVKRRRVFVCAVLASLGETLILCVPVGNSSLKLVVGFGGITAGLIYWLFRPKSWEYFYRLLIFSYISSGVLGGILLVSELVLGKYVHSYHWWCIVIFVSVKIVEEIYKRMSVGNEFKEVELMLSGGSKCTLTALVDSGNSLVEPISGTPVSVVEKGVLEEFQTELTEDKFRIVPFCSVGKEHGILEAYFIERLEIKREGENVVIEKPMIAITKERISSKQEYQMILHPALLDY